jgi:hypothetical protein
MKDERYTVENPPEEGVEVWVAGPDWRSVRYSVWAHGGFLLENGCLHRTEESAKAHAKRMLMVDDILELLDRWEEDAQYWPANHLHYSHLLHDVRKVINEASEKLPTGGTAEYGTHLRIR